jgi:hypothetical protein
MTGALVRHKTMKKGRVLRHRPLLGARAREAARMPACRRFQNVFHESAKTFYLMLRSLVFYTSLGALGENSKTKSPDKAEFPALCGCR